MSFSKSVRLIAARKDRTSTNRLLLQPDMEWQIWHVLAVLPPKPAGLHSIFQWTQLLRSTCLSTFEATYKADCQDPAITDKH